MDINKLLDRPETFYYLSIITILFVVGNYFFTIYYYSVNIPFWDDYTHLSVITRIIDSESLLEKIQLFFSLHNEHRIVFARLITLGILLVNGEVNFVVLIMFGNLLSIIGIGVLLFLSFCSTQCQDIRWKLVYFLPVIFLLFNLSYFEASVWALAALSSLVVIFLAFLCIFVLCSDNQSLRESLLAFFLGAFSVFTQGNGLLVLYVGIFLLILQKRFVTAVPWTAGTIMTSILYFYNYTSPEFHPDPVGAFSALAMTLRYLFTFLGSWSFMPLLIGILCVTLFVWLILAGLHRKNLVLFGFLVFVFVSAFAAALSRYGMGIEQALSSRYRIYSLLFFALLYMSIFEFLERSWLMRMARKGFPAIIILFLVMNVYTTVKASGNMAARQRMLVDGLVMWQMQGEGLVHWDAIVADKIITEAKQNGIYYPPNFRMHGAAF